MRKVSAVLGAVACALQVTPAAARVTVIPRLQDDLRIRISLQSGKGEMSIEIEDVATTMEEILSVVVKEKIGPDGFSESDTSANWRRLDARDCKNQVEYCRAWIRTQERTKTIRPGVSSADYMHTVERYFNHHI